MVKNRICIFFSQSYLFTLLVLLDSALGLGSISAGCAFHMHLDQFRILKQWNIFLQNFENKKFFVACLCLEFSNCLLISSPILHYFLGSPHDCSWSKGVCSMMKKFLRNFWALESRQMLRKDFKPDSIQDLISRNKKSKRTHKS
jgi:hypothetical protein